jgi:hypothetical protein
MKRRLTFALYTLSVAAVSMAQTRADVLTCIQKAGADVTSLQPCEGLAAGVEDHRISEAFQQLSLSSANSAETVAREEAEWHKFRSQVCVHEHDVADFGCLQTLGAIQADSIIKKIGSNFKYDPGEVPYQLWGTWIVTREIPTRTITCWDDKQSRALIGEHIDYGPHSLRWREINNQHVLASVSIFDAHSFWSTYSSPSSDGSQVDFAQLGLNAPLVSSVSLRGFQHEEQTDDDAPPGSNVLLKSPQQLIFEVCNVYFEATKSSLHATGPIIPASHPRRSRPVTF